MTTVSRPDISNLQEDLGPQPPVSIKTPDGVPMASPAASTGGPANEIQIDTPVVVIRFTRGRCAVEDPIGTLVALEDAPSKIGEDASATDIASLLRDALTRTAKIEFDSGPKELTFTETRAISDAIVRWSVELGKP